MAEAESIIPIIPSPMMIRVRAPIRSTMFVLSNFIESYEYESLRRMVASRILMIYLHKVSVTVFRVGT
jgi:hypothetical protein